MADDRLIATLRSLVKSMFPSIDHLALYPAKAIAQNGDGSLEVKPDDVRLPAISRVPIRYGIPGVKVKVAPGARVLLGFAGGDPQQPVVELWESGSVTEMTIDGTTIVLNGGTLSVARVTDLVAADTSMAAFLAQVTAALAGAGPASRIPGLTAPVDFGKVSTGATGVKA